MRFRKIIVDGKEKTLHYTPHHAELWDGMKKEITKVYEVYKLRGKLDMFADNYYELWHPNRVSIANILLYRVQF